MTDPIADMFARIKNAGMRSYKTVDIPASKMKKGILQVLEREGYIAGFSQVEEGSCSYLRVDLKYFDGKPVIQVLDRVSKCSCRVFSKLKNIPRMFNGFGIYILSTSRGIVSDAEAREMNIGGEVLGKVF